ncbi:hypothetical protein KQX54_003135 [Cotesia glomerata]|uniref:Uncharacterized protein n=1 Tax=Cotesia glomerata TaxID=32391 RepID=A0AAV7HZU7_COTGL|nr:hypothetical protein KQX54_003135 [Cotesia glomerata]
MDTHPRYSCSHMVLTPRASLPYQNEFTDVSHCSIHLTSLFLSVMKRNNPSELELLCTELLYSIKKQPGLVQKVYIQNYRTKVLETLKQNKEEIFQLLLVVSVESNYTYEVYDVERAILHPELEVSMPIEPVETSQFPLILHQFQTLLPFPPSKIYFSFQTSE